VCDYNRFGLKNETGYNRFDRLALKMAITHTSQNADRSFLSKGRSIVPLKMLIDLSSQKVDRSSRAEFEIRVLP
jgi:hypothetical protein